MALGYSPTACAGSLKQRRPRSSMVENRSRRTPASICVQRPRGPKSRGPVTACPVAPSLSATLPDRAPARASTADPVHRWSKIGRVAHPHQYACNDRGGPKSLGPVNACPVAPSLKDTSPDHVPARESTAGPVYRWSKIGRVARPRQYACNDRGGRNPEVRQQPAPSRHRSLPLPQTVRRLAQAPPAPFIDGRKSVASHAHTNMRATTEGAEILRSGNSLPRRAMALGHSPRPCAASRTLPPPLLDARNLFLRPPAPIWVQASV
jgi:hypothetical protein